MAWNPISGKNNIIVYKHNLNQFKQAPKNYNIRVISGFLLIFSCSKSQLFGFEEIY
jgi:hypothetical protein